MLTAILKVGDSDPQFLLALPHRAGFRAFTLLDFAAGAVDLAFSQAGFLVNQQYFAIADNEYQGCRIFSLPVIPVNI